MTGQEKLYWKVYEARELIANGWCQNSSSKLIDGTKCRLSHPEATHFCAAGANAKVSDGDKELIKKMNMEFDGLIPDGFKSIVDYNDMDDTTQADIVSLYDRVLAELKKEINNNGRK